jgi:hypothetical protein
MLFTIEARPSDSPFVETIWRARSERDGAFLSIASARWEMVVSKREGRTTLTVRGPETKVMPLECAAGGEWLGIRFRLGAVMPHLPASDLLDGAVNLPAAGSRSFWLHGFTWQYPDFERADAFVDRLVRRCLLVRDPVVDDFLSGGSNGHSARTAQRHIRQATGLTLSLVRQIERARHAAILLQHGASILDTVHEAGYFDQPHLTRSLRRFIGQTPAQLADPMRSAQLSLLGETGSGW